MENDELIIRKHLKSLSHVDIADSIYLFGVNLDTEPIDSIMQDIYTLHREIRTLRSMIDRNFVPINGELIPQGRQAQTAVIQSCHHKEQSFAKIMSNETLYKCYIRYAADLKKQEQHTIH